MAIGAVVGVPPGTAALTMAVRQGADAEFRRVITGHWRS